jgi:hypothetical protein
MDFLQRRSRDLALTNTGGVSRLLQLSLKLPN